MNFASNGNGKSPATDDFPYARGMDSIGVDGDWSSENIPRSEFCVGGMQDMDRAVIVETASAAMDELVELLRMDDPVWVSAASGDGRSTLHRDSYDKLFPKPNHFKSAAARMESSKESGEVAMAAAQLVEAFLDPVRTNRLFKQLT